MKNKVLIYVGIIVIGAIASFVNAYIEASSYESLVKKHPLKIKTKKPVLQAKSLSIYSTKPHDTSVGLGDKMNLVILDDELLFVPKGIYAFLFPGFQLNSNDINSCSKQCGGSTRYLIILESLGLQLSFEEVPQLIEWCWGNKLPMLSSKNRRDWLYTSIKLSNRATEIDKLTTYEDYLHQAKQSCNGY